MIEVMRRFAHDVLGWHDAKGWNGAKGFDGASLTGICSRCNKRVLMDSQGNWFMVGDKDK